MLCRMTSITFFDVEQADRPLVTSTLAGAAFLPADLPEAEIAAQCGDTEIISTFITTAFPRGLVAKLPRLKLLCTRSVGHDHIDVAACRERGIVVCNVPDYGSHVIAEHVFALLLSELRHIHLGSERVKGGDFDYHGLRGIALKGKTIGIVGTGKIGRQAARIAHGFGMAILATDQCRTTELETQLGVRYVPLRELLGKSDIVTLHLPAMPETEHLIDASALALMKQGAVLVNTARGSLIDSAALLAALQAGRLSHVLLDVLEHERNFQENRDLVKHPRVVVTPHIAFYADDSLRNMYTDCFQSIAQWQSGKRPDHAVETATVICDLPPIR